MLLAIASIPEAAEARPRAAAAAGLALADLSRRLAGTLPRVLLASVPEDRGRALALTLEGLGFGILTCDVAAVPSDEDRIVARRIELAPDTLIVTDARGQAHRCPGRAIGLLQRGMRVTRSENRVKTTERRLSIGKALLTGGLVLTEKVEKTTVNAVETGEPFLLLGRSDGEPDVVLYERRIDYRSMGAEMQPSSRANLERLWDWLRRLVPPETIDDRVARPGFVSGLPATAADPVDLALFLVALARRSGRSTPGGAPP
jgi:hypothetical protein